MEFRDDELLARALAHRSWCAETAGTDSNERLEFLGDAVLGLIVTDHIFRTYPLLPEGELAKVRASVVNAGVLAELAAELRLGTALLLGVDGVCIISHGSSGPRAVVGAVRLAAEMVEAGLVDRLRAAVGG